MKRGRGRRRGARFVWPNLGTANRFASAQDAASRVIQEHETVRLSRAEQIAFVSALLKPPAANARLRQAAAAYRKQMGL